MNAHCEVAELFCRDTTLSQCRLRLNVRPVALKTKRCWCAIWQDYRYETKCLVGILYQVLSITQSLTRSLTLVDS